MTSITMRVAMWERHLALVPPEDDVLQFADVRLDVLHVDDCLLFSPSPSGTPMHHKERHETRGKPSCQAYEFWSNRTDCGLADMPRFALHEVDMTLDDTGDMTWEMPPAHELPWPVHVRGMSREDATAVVERELRVRVDSCGDSDYTDLTKVAAAVPAWARNVIRAEQWARIFKRENRHVHCAA